MLTLFYSPGACSLSVHIALCENNLKFNLSKVDLATKRVIDGTDYMNSNPKGYVPMIQLEDGQKLTECAAILFYISEQNSKSLATIQPGSLQRYRLQEALTFVSSELHKSIGAFFDSALQGEYREKVSAKIKKRLDIIEQKLSNAEYLVGNDFTVADAYCFTILRWLNILDTGLKIVDWPKINAYWTKIYNRPQVQKALKEEGLTK